MKFSYRLLCCVAVSISLISNGNRTECAVVRFVNHKSYCHKFLLSINKKKYSLRGQNSIVMKEREIRIKFVQRRCLRDEMFILRPSHLLPTIRRQKRTHVFITLNVIV